jgi:hypothetical protein
MNSHSAEVSLLALPLVLLAAAVISVPIARFLRLSAIVAYLIAGVVIGPFGFGIFKTPEQILTVAELGVVMLLFLIGLELELSRLLAMRRAIFGLGVAQLVLTAAAIAASRLRPACSTGAPRWSPASRSRSRRPRSRCASWRIAAPCRRLRPARLRDPAVSGHGGRAAARAGAAARRHRAGDRAAQPRRDREQRRADRRRDRRAGHRRALSAQSVLPPARLDRTRAR